MTCIYYRHTLNSTGAPVDLWIVPRIDGVVLAKDTFYLIKQKRAFRLLRLPNARLAEENAFKAYSTKISGR